MHPSFPPFSPSNAKRNSEERPPCVPLLTALQTNQAVIGLVCVPDVFKAADSDSNFRYVSCRGCEAFNNIIHDPHITSGSFLNAIVRPSLAPRVSSAGWESLKTWRWFWAPLAFMGRGGRGGREGKGKEKERRKGCSEGRKGTCARAALLPRPSGKTPTKRILWSGHMGARWPSFLAASPPWPSGTLGLDGPALLGNEMSKLGKALCITRVISHADIFDAQRNIFRERLAKRASHLSSGNVNPVCPWMRESNEVWFYNSDVYRKMI